MSEPEMCAIGVMACVAASMIASHIRYEMRGGYWGEVLRRERKIHEMELEAEREEAEHRQFLALLESIERWNGFFKKLEDGESMARPMGIAGHVTERPMSQNEQYEALRQDQRSAMEERRRLLWLWRKGKAIDTSLLLLAACVVGAGLRAFGNPLPWICAAIDAHRGGLTLLLGLCIGLGVRVRTAKRAVERGGLE